jgi:hypothetical protein
MSSTDTRYTHHEVVAPRAVGPSGRTVTFPQKYLKKSPVFGLHKTWFISPRFTTHFTTNSPSKNHVLHTNFLKPPSKTAAKTAKRPLSITTGFFSVKQEV